jgi:hypothetical protein
MVWINRSTRPFRFGAATRRALVQIPFAFNATVSFFINFGSRSCITIAGFTVRLPECLTKASVCSTTERESGLLTLEDTITSRDSWHRNTRRDNS